MTVWILLGWFFIIVNCKNCIHCKHYINEKYKRDPLYVRFGKCKLFPLYDPIIDEKYLVPLLQEYYDPNKPLNHSFCSTARFFRDMCGHTAKKFEPLQEEEEKEEKEESK